MHAGKALVAPVRGNTQAAYPPSLPLLGAVPGASGCGVHMGTLLRKLCSQHSLVSVMSLAFLASLRKLFFLKKARS